MNNNSTTSSIISNNSSTSRSTRSQSLKRKLDTEAVRWPKLYNDLLLSIIQYCDQLTVTQLVMHINQYWYTIAKHPIVWNNRLIEFTVPYSLDQFSLAEFELFIDTHPYLINVNSWCWYGLHYYNPLYDPSNQSIALILQSQSTSFNQLQSIKFNKTDLSKSDMIVICTSFNSLISLSFIYCNLENTQLDQLSLKQYVISDNNSNKQHFKTKSNLLLTQLKQLEIHSLSIDNTNTNFLYNFIQLESLTINYCRINRLIASRFPNKSIGFYSTIANRMPSLTYLNTDEYKLSQSELAAISQLIKRLNICIISNASDCEGINQLHSSDWINIFKSGLINNTNSLQLQHIRLPYSGELIDYLIQFPALTRLDIEYYYPNGANNDLKSLSSLSQLKELHILSYRRYDPEIKFIGFEYLIKLKIFYIDIVDSDYAKQTYSEFKELLIELSKCQSLTELYLNKIFVELPLKQQNEQSIISIELIEFIDLLGKFNKLKFIHISESILRSFYLNIEVNINKRTRKQWIKELNNKLSKLLPNTVIELEY